MARATWNNTVLAESKDTIVVEGNHYFPPDSIDAQRFAVSETRSLCGWKGEARYYHIEVDGKVNHDAAWYYPSPKLEAAKIKDYVAFWKGVQVETGS